MSTSSLVESLKSVAHSIVVVDIEHEPEQATTLAAQQTPAMDKVKTTSLETLEALEKLDEAIDEFNKTVDKVETKLPPSPPPELSSPKVDTNENVKQLVEPDVVQPDTNENSRTPPVPTRSNSIHQNGEEDGETLRLDENNNNNNDQLSADASTIEIREEEDVDEDDNNEEEEEESTPPQLPPKDYEEVEDDTFTTKPIVAMTITAQAPTKSYEEIVNVVVVGGGADDDHKSNEDGGGESNVVDNNNSSGSKKSGNVLGKFIELVQRKGKTEVPPELPPKDYAVEEEGEGEGGEDLATIDIAVPAEGDNETNASNHKKLEAVPDTLDETLKEFNEQVTELSGGGVGGAKRAAPPVPPTLPQPKLMGIRFADGHIRPVRLKQSKKIREILQQFKVPERDDDDDDDDVVVDAEEQARPGHLSGESGNGQHSAEGTNSMQRGRRSARRRPVQENVKYFQSLQTQVEPPQCAIYTQVVNEIKGVRRDANGHRGEDNHDDDDAHNSSTD